MSSLHVIKKLVVSKTEKNLVMSRNGARCKVESHESDARVPSARFLSGNTVRMIQLCKGGKAGQRTPFFSVEDYVFSTVYWVKPHGVTIPRKV